MNNNPITLPNDFFFGAALSGPQTEGAWQSFGKIENIWDTWSNLDLGAFHNRVGSYGGNDMTRHMQEDFELFASLGFQSARTSIQWSRLMDADGKLNPEGAAYYHKLFSVAREAGIEPFVNLYHFDMPAYLLRRGGWESREVVEAYATYAATAFAEFGQEIEHWFTFNEPIVEPEQRYEHDIACVVVAIASFFVTMPQSVEVVVNDVTGMASGVFSTANTGTSGLFGAIIIGFLATALFIKLSSIDKLKINLGEGVPPAVAGSFNTMIPMLLTLACFGLLSAVLFVGFNTDLATLIKQFVQAPLQSLNSNIWGVVIIYSHLVHKKSTTSFFQTTPTRPACHVIGAIINSV